MYTHAPITEAVIEIRFGAPISADSVRKAAGRIGERYPFHDDDNGMDIHVDVNAGRARQTPYWTGKRLNSIDRVDVTILKTNSVVFSRLAPYAGWEQFRSRARDDWETARKTFGFVKIERIGVRYINRIDVPAQSGAISVEKFLNVYPESRSLGLPPMESYAFQIARPLGSLSCGVVINSATVPSPLLNHVSFVIDFDIGRDLDVPQKDDDIWALIEQIRVAKNQLFEAAITDHSRVLFRK